MFLFYSTTLFINSVESKPYYIHHWNMATAHYGCADV